MLTALSGREKDNAGASAEKWEDGRNCASSLTRSLCSGRETAAGAAYSHTELNGRYGGKEKDRPKAAGNPFFHRLRLP